MSTVERSIFSEQYANEALEGPPGEEERVAQALLDFVEGAYTHRERLGIGKAAEVWFGEPPIFDRDLCIKALHETGFGKSINSMAREFEIQQRFFNAGVHVPEPFLYVEGKDNHGENEGIIAMERIDGVNCKELVREMVEQGKKFTAQEFSDILTQVRQQITIAHEAGLFHRDLHIENVIIDRAGKVWLIDFGEALVAQTHDEREDPYTVRRAIGSHADVQNRPPDEDSIKEIRQAFYLNHLVTK